MQPKIIAVDFDGTLCENEWPGIGKPIERNIQRVKAWQAAGAKLILWTNRVTERLSEAVDWCADHGIVFNAVNENLPEILDAFGTDCRKIYADVYFDDRAVNSSDESNIVRHGRWETWGYVFHGIEWKRCSCCGKCADVSYYGLLDGEIRMSTPAICGCCGAHMDGGADNDKR